MKKFLRAILLLTCCLGAAQAVDWTALKPQGYVNDFANVIDPASKLEIEHYCGQVEKATGAQIAVLTVTSLEDEPIEDAANTIFRAWGVGQKGKNNGILIMLAIRERRMRLEVGYELEPIIPDGFAGSILRQMRPALRQNQYGEGFLFAAHTVGQQIAQAKGVTIDAETPVRRTRERPDQRIPWPSILGGLAILFLLSRGGRGGGSGFLMGLLLGSLTGRGFGGGYGGRSRGGGGFGGFDGGGFGGFGGGDSGGGGASSGW
jgi:uncharacterized protein